MNPGYIEFGRARYRGEFIAADALAYEPRDGCQFDLILLNSFLHHVDDETARRLLARLNGFLANDGTIHLLDLVLPEERSLARWLAVHDRGDYPRPLAEWRGLFEERFECTAFQPYPLGIFGLTMWQMVYLKGTRRA